MHEDKDKKINRFFKFRELKVYSSTEWLAENRKRYRQVFDRKDTAYVYAELSFYNKLFDEEDWEVDILLRCYSLKKVRKEVCALPFRKKVSKYDPVIYIREGWGNKKKGVFWKRGNYVWEAWLDGEKVGSRYFYIEDSEDAEQDPDVPFVKVDSFRMYEGAYEDNSDEERVYYKTFSADNSRYIYVETILKNLNHEKSWQCEVSTKFFTDARELKGQVTRLQKVNKKDDNIYVTAGWGANTKGSWRVVSTLQRLSL